MTYGSVAAAEYRIGVEDFDIAHGYNGELIAPEFSQTVRADIRVIGEHSLRPVAAALAVAVKLGLPQQTVVDGIEDIYACSWTNESAARSR